MRPDVVEVHTITVSGCGALMAVVFAENRVDML